ncbi:MAG: ABC transporter ATP-binding protein [Planctomycetota bacterium]|nr:ABC transporter ATP-binding protein [Planctomycetota bacterium]
MTTEAQTTPESPRDEASARRASMRALVRCVGRGVARNKALVACALVAASLEAFFTKAPFVLVKPLFDTIAPSPAVGSGGTGLPDGVELDFAVRFTQGFGEFADGLAAFLGLSFEGDAHSKAVVVACACLAAVAGILGGLAIYTATLLSRYFSTKVVVGLRDELAAHVLRLPLRFFGKRRMGELISRLTNDTAVLGRAFELISDHLIVDPLMILMNIGIVWMFAPEMLLVFLPAIPLMALPMLRLGRKVHRRSAGSLAAMGDATESMNQMLSGIKVVKAFGLEDVRLAEFERNNQTYLQRTVRMLKAKGRSQGMVFVGYQVGFVGMILVMGWLLIDGPKTIGDIGVILVPISTTYQHVKRLVRIWNTAMESAGAMVAIDQLLAERPDAALADGSALRRIERVTGDIRVEDVAFSYEDEPVLRGVSFAVQPGSTVAFVGPSGAGKSTMIDLLARFHDPVAGRVLIDGVDLREIDLASYRAHTAMVVQQPFLFNTTILANIRYGRPDATMEEVVEAAKAAQIHDFVESLPRGYETVVGERGSNLSGGQMQRITIARAIVRDPAVLFLDEATSALDSESEEAVQRALGNLRKGRTSFVIAHRLSTIRDADQILVFEAGKVVERGRHEELVERGGVYRRLIELQDLQ